MKRWIWLVAAGCDDHLYGVANRECRVSTGFVAVEEMVDEYCLACHSVSPIGNSLDLETDLYRTLTERFGSTNLRLIIPGDPDRSYFYQKLVGTNTDGTGVMPVGGQLPACETDRVKEWILAGATLE